MKKNYIDITNRWLKLNPCIINEIKLYNLNDVFQYKNKTYRYDGHFVKYQFNENEKSFATWLSRRIAKNITLIPKIEYPQKIKTADYRIGNNYYDLKTIYGQDKQIIYHKIRNKKDQCKRFIFDISKKSSLTLEELIKQANELFGSMNNDRNWVEMIGIRYKNQFIMLKRK